MKKLFIILTLLLCIALAACDASEEQTGVTTNSNTSSSTASDTNGNFDNCTEVYFYEKYGNSVYFAFEEQKTNCYTIVSNYEKNIVVPTDIPNDEKSYFKFIETYDELATYISTPNVDASVFENNYIVCIKEAFYLSSGWENYFKLLGYSDFKFTDNRYEISRSCYFSVEHNGEHLDILSSVTMVNYLIIPKTEIEFIEGVCEIAVNKHQINGDNGIWTDEFLGGNKNPMPPSTDTHAYLSHNTTADLPSNSTAWVVKKGSELEKQLGLSSNSYSDFRVVLYLPSEPKYDFIITEKEIKNGSLYLTVEEYTQYTNEYLNRNDVKFYDLYISDTIELVDNFDVYILIKTVE